MGGDQQRLVHIHFLACYFEGRMTSPEKVLPSLAFMPSYRDPEIVKILRLSACPHSTTLGLLKRQMLSPTFPII